MVENTHLSKNSFMFIFCLNLLYSDRRGFPNKIGRYQGLAILLLDMSIFYLLDSFFFEFLISLISTRILVLHILRAKVTHIYINLAFVLFLSLDGCVLTVQH